MPRPRPQGQGAAGLCGVRAEEGGGAPLLLLSLLLFSLSLLPLLLLLLLLPLLLLPLLLLPLLLLPLLLPLLPLMPGAVVLNWLLLLLLAGLLGGRGEIRGAPELLAGRLWKSLPTSAAQASEEGGASSAASVVWCGETGGEGGVRGLIKTEPSRGKRSLQKKQEHGKYCLLPTSVLLEGVGPHALLLARLVALLAVRQGQDLCGGGVSVRGELLRGRWCGDMI
jgi:hypothetical protein